VETYQLDPTGTKLVLIPQDVYSVDVSAASKNDFALEKGDCERTKVKAGVFLRIEKYDSQKQRFLLRTSDGVCGWLRNGELDNKVAELPWAK
jgi:hypothetical protein